MLVHQAVQFVQLAIIVQLHKLHNYLQFVHLAILLDPIRVLILARAVLKGFTVKIQPSGQLIVLQDIILLMVNMHVLYVQKECNVWEELNLE